MKSIKSLILVGLIITGTNVCANDIARQASDATAAALSVTVQGVSSVVGCTMIVKGIKAGVPYLNSLDPLNEISAPYVTAACSALYGYFLIAAATGTKPETLNNSENGFNQTKN